MIKSILASASVLALVACGQAAEEEKAASDAASEVTAVAETAVEAATSAVDGAKLDVILAAQPEGNQARYAARHPKETLEFFGIEPGMVVADTLPGNGYYGRILLPYLGGEGKLIGVDYSVDMWGLFGGFATEEFLENKKTWTDSWSKDAEGWRADGDAGVDAFVFGGVDDAHAGTVDAFLLIRAFHHLNRFEDEGQYRTKALADILKVLKPGGIVGIVQHSGPETNDDKWAEGDNGYLKQSQVIASMEAAGFEFIASSDVNANPNDVPTNEEFVWRLPPALATSREDAELKAKMEAIGESNRMTLKFRKPA